MEWIRCYCQVNGNFRSRNSHTICAHGYTILLSNPTLTHAEQNIQLTGFEAQE